MILSRTSPTCSPFFFEMTIFRNSILSGTEFLIVYDENPAWWHLGRIVQIKNTRVWKTGRPYWNCTTWRFIRRESGPDYHRLKAMVKRSIEQNLRIKALCWMNSEGNDHRWIWWESSSSRIPCSSSRTRSQNSTRGILRQQQDFREVHQQESYEDEGIARIPKFYLRWVHSAEVHRGSEKLLWNYLERLQELQNEVNCMNDSKDFQDAESMRSGNSHVTSQPGVFP